MHSLPNLTLPENRSGQLGISIYTNYVELESPMLHAKFQDHRISGSGEDFLEVFTIFGMAAIFVM